MTVFERGNPIVVHTVVVRYINDTAGAMWAGSTTTWREMKTALWAMPVPKPLGMMG